METFEIMTRSSELSSRGLCCSQILMQIVGLDARGTDNPDLLKAMGAFCYGLHNQFICGALSGGASALSLHANGKEQTVQLCNSLIHWFQSSYGSTQCSGILGEGNPPTMLCGEIIAETAERCLELVAEFI
jgi:hypothetical protein